MKGKEGLQNCERLEERGERRNRMWYPAQDAGSEKNEFNLKICEVQEKCIVNNTVLMLILWS